MFSRERELFWFCLEQLYVMAYVLRAFIWTVSHLSSKLAFFVSDKQVFNGPFFPYILWWHLDGIIIRGHAHILKYFPATALRDL